MFTERKVAQLSRSLTIDYTLCLCCNRPIDFAVYYIIFQENGKVPKWNSNGGRRLMGIGGKAVTQQPRFVALCKTQFSILKTLGTLSLGFFHNWESFSLNYGQLEPLKVIHNICNLRGQLPISLEQYAVFWRNFMSRKRVVTSLT